MSCHKLLFFSTKTLAFSPLGSMLYIPIHVYEYIPTIIF